MSIEPNAVIPAKKPGSRKRGGQPGNTNAFKLKWGQSASAHKVPVKWE